LAQSYAALRIYCLAPPRFTKSKLSNEEVRIDAQT
jgi:hypothetical protein